MVESANWIAWGGHALAVLLGVVVFRIGFSRGAGRTNRRWRKWMGITLEELESGAFTDQVRAFRRQVERPSDQWPG
jgi:high-affinity Fe2+/Pb2+ permease